MTDGCNRFIGILCQRRSIQYQVSCFRWILGSRVLPLSLHNACTCCRKEAGAQWTTFLRNVVQFFVWANRVGSLTDFDCTHTHGSCLGFPFFYSLFPCPGGLFTKADGMKDLWCSTVQLLRSNTDRENTFACKAHDNLDILKHTFSCWNFWINNSLLDFLSIFLQLQSSSFVLQSKLHCFYFDDYSGRGESQGPPPHPLCMNPGHASTVWLLRCIFTWSVHTYGCKKISPTKFQVYTDAMHVWKLGHKNFISKNFVFEQHLNNCEISTPWKLQAL